MDASFEPQPEYGATIVSAVPFPIKWEPIGIMPAVFEIAPAEPPNINVLHITEVEIRRYFGFDSAKGAAIAIPKKPDEIAASLVYDYLNSQIYLAEDSHPAIFAKKGLWPKNICKVKFRTDLDNNLEAQRRWFQLIVQKADDVWQQTHLHIHISALDRYAAKALGLTREWTKLVDPKKQTQDCPFCESPISPSAMVCRHCQNVVNIAAYAAYQKELAAATKPESLVANLNAPTS